MRLALNITYAISKSYSHTHPSMRALQTLLWPVALHRLV